MELNIVISVFISLLTISSTIFIVILQRKSEKIKIIESQLSQKKYDAYNNIVVMFYEILKDVKDNKSSHTKNLTRDLIDSKKNLFMFGSDEVFRKFNAWLCFTSEKPGDNKHFKLFLELMLEIRKEMRNEKTDLTKEDLMVNLMQNREEVKKLKQFWE